MGSPNPRRSEALRRRWADPEQRARMIAGAARGHVATARKLTGGRGESGDPTPEPPASDPPPTSPGGGSLAFLGRLITSTPRDAVDALRGKR